MTDYAELFSKHTQELTTAAGRIDEFYQQVGVVVQQIREAVSRGAKVLVAGNGGSAAEAQHFSDEMVGRYKKDRPAYPAIALTADGAVVTCIGNDYGFENVFKRQVEALGREGDIFIGLTTSSSANIVAAAKQARDQGMTVIAMTGQSGEFKDMADYAIVSPSEKTSIVQELHLHAIHLIFEAFDAEQIDFRDMGGESDPALSA